MTIIDINSEIVEDKTRESNSLVFFNSLRVIAMICVIIFHAVASYSMAALYWAVQDPNKDIISDFIRYFFEVFIMPLFFFISGYFGIKSLQKYSAKKFLYSKFNRLMIYWIFIVIVILPFFLDKSIGFVGSTYSNYFEYWLIYITTFGTIRIGPLNSKKFQHMHFWFISLLFYFFIILMIIYYLAEKLGVNIFQENDSPITKKSMLMTIIVFGMVISLGTFILLLISAEQNWIIINFIIQFKISAIFTCGGLFSLGAYASTKKWFVTETKIGCLKMWLIASCILIILFFLIGGDILINNNSHLLNPGILLVFAFIRSFLCISIIFLLLSLTMRYMNKPSFFNTELADHSYNIYLIHLFIVITFQMTFLHWTGGPNLIKIFIITLASLFICFSISKYIFKNISRKIGILVLTIVFFILPLLAIIFPILNEF